MPQVIPRPSASAVRAYSCSSACSSPSATQSHTLRTPRPSAIFRQARHASTSTVPLKQTRARAKMWAWLRGPGRVFQEPLENSTNYLNAYTLDGRPKRPRASTSADGKGGGELQGAEHPFDMVPFPLNPYFRSQPVLSNAFKDEICRRISTGKQSVREVSQLMQVDMRRVAAVVRLKAVEEQWNTQGRKMATPYEKAIMSMLPKTDTSNNSKRIAHEPINDLPVHRSTLHQLFVPTSESREFTRADAGRVFNRHLLPADDRIPHPDMIITERERASGTFNDSEVDARRRERWTAEEEKRVERSRKAAEREARNTTTVAGKRWDFVFKGMDTERVAGKTGRDGSSVDGRGQGNSAAGESVVSGKLRSMNKKAGEPWRYGLPREDRKKGMVKIETSVE